MTIKYEEELYKKIIGENIRKIRKRNGLTQDIFSEKIGIESANLSNIENGKSFPSALTIIQIQKKFQISTEEIFNADDYSSMDIIEKDISNIIFKMNDKQKRLLWRIIKLIN